MEIEGILDWDLEETENEGERTEKEGCIWELIRARREYLQGLEPQLIDLEVLMDEFQDIVDEEKESSE